MVASDVAMGIGLASSTPEAVVMGASAGGIQALNRLLPALPADFAPSLLIVVHMPSDTPSLLGSIYAERCVLPVTMAEDKQPIMPATVVFGPSSYHTLVEPNRTIALSVDPPEHFSRPSIDALFESAAYAYGHRLLGILLTGANDDGAEGLFTIQQVGGRTWVQDPRTAVSDVMPLSALRRGVNAEILTLDAMAGKLALMRTRPVSTPNSNS